MPGIALLRGRIQGLQNKKCFTPGPNARSQSFFAGAPRRRRPRQPLAATAEMLNYLEKNIFGSRLGVQEKQWKNSPTIEFLPGVKRKGFPKHQVFPWRKAVFRFQNALYSGNRVKVGILGTTLPQAITHGWGVFWAIPASPARGGARSAPLCYPRGAAVTVFYYYYISIFSHKSRYPYFSFSASK